MCATPFAVLVVRPPAVPSPPGATWAMPVGVVVVRPPWGRCWGVDVVGASGFINHPLPIVGARNYHAEPA